MPLTRAHVEAELIARRGLVCARIPLFDPTAVTAGSVAALAAPISRALRACGVTAADPTNPTTADLADVKAWDEPKLIDLADLFVLEACAGNWAEWDETVGPKSQMMGKFGERLDAMLAAQRAWCVLQYNYGQQAGSFGTLDLGFAATERCEP